MHRGDSKKEEPPRKLGPDEDEWTREDLGVAVSTGDGSFSKSGKSGSGQSASGSSTIRGKGKKRALK